MKQEILSAYVAILQEELVLATGCTEPIAIAYAAAKLREVLGAEPERIEAEVSGNILKNVKSVVVPNTGGLKGIRPAIAAGVVAGRPEAELQVISEVSEDQLGAPDGRLSASRRAVCRRAHGIGAELCFSRERRGQESGLDRT